MDRLAKYIITLGGAIGANLSSNHVQSTEVVNHAAMGFQESEAAR
jgi:hypothetical protein